MGRLWNRLHINGMEYSPLNRGGELAIIKTSSFHNIKMEDRKSG